MTELIPSIRENDEDGAQKIADLLAANDPELRIYLHQARVQAREMGLSLREIMLRRIRMNLQRRENHKSRNTSGEDL